MKFPFDREQENVHKIRIVRWMMHDPVEFPQPEIFKPERFLPAPGERLPIDPSKIAFGFGRR